MGWSTTLFCNIEFNRKSYNSLYEVEEDIETTKKIIQMHKDKIKAYALMTEPNKMIKINDEQDDNLLMKINYIISSILEELEDYYYDLFKLQYLKENWNYCHNDKGLAIDPPNNISWNTAYLSGDFVKSINYPNE